jgi:hypothetical protein
MRCGPGGGLGTYYILLFIHLGTREVHVAGFTPHPDQQWMIQIARHVTVADWGFLAPRQYLIHDRDGKCCPAFQHLIDDAAVQRIVLPPQSPNLNAYAERWVRSVKDEVLSRLILFGEPSLRHTLSQYTIGYCWSTPFKVLEVLFLGEVCSAFLPSKKACWAHQFQYLGVDQQYPKVSPDTFRTHCGKRCNSLAAEISPILSESHL